MRFFSKTSSLKFEIGLSPKHNRYNPNSNGSLRVLRRQNGMVKNTAFLSICILLILPSVIITNEDLLNTQLIFNFYAQISCKNDWNNFLLLNTNAPLSRKMEEKTAVNWVA